MYLIDREKFGASTEAEAAPFTLPHLISWLRKQDVDEEYNYFCVNGSCLIGLYSAAHGFGHLGFYTQYTLLNTGCRRGDAAGEITAGLPYTFGAALARAEKLLALGRAPNSLPYGDL